MDRDFESAWYKTYIVGGAKSPKHKLISRTAEVCAKQKRHTIPKLPSVSQNLMCLESPGLTSV
jgi:hypothetical protein